MAGHVTNLPELMKRLFYLNSNITNVKPQSVTWRCENFFVTVLGEEIVEDLLDALSTHVKVS